MQFRTISQTDISGQPVLLKTSRGQTTQNELRGGETSTETVDHTAATSGQRKQTLCRSDVRREEGTSAILRGEEARRPGPRNCPTHSHKPLRNGLHESWLSFTLFPAPNIFFFQTSQKFDLCNAHESIGEIWSTGFNGEFCKMPKMLNLVEEFWKFESKWIIHNSFDVVHQAFESWILFFWRRTLYMKMTFMDSLSDGGLLKKTEDAEYFFRASTDNFEPNHFLEFQFSIFLCAQALSNVERTKPIHTPLCLYWRILERQTRKVFVIHTHRIFLKRSIKSTAIFGSMFFS